MRTLLPLAALLALAASAPAEAAAPRRYAVIVANNQSLDEGVAPLAYAVDDGAKYLELFRAAGVEAALLASFDADGARRHPEAAAAATAPTRQAVAAAVESAFDRIRADRDAGLETHFYFVFTGHGGLGANREGYVSLLDAKLRRTELYREVIARSPASFNHLVLDACHAYYFVLKRGDTPEAAGDFRAAVRDFLRAEDLASYPNTGVILASSSSSETHEWSRWEAGIFSHELRSGLLGAADVDGDNQVTYDEAAAFVEAANAAIDVPRARLRVFYRPPASRKDLPLLDLSALALPRLQIDPERAGHYHLEDTRGVRVADFHPTREQATRVALLGKAPFFLRSELEEATVEGSAPANARDLAFGPLSERAKGSVESSFRRNLFSTAFGVSFLKGMMAERSRLESELEIGRTVAPGPALGTKGRWGVGGLALGLATGMASGGCYALAADAHRRYADTRVPSEARRYRSLTEDRLLASQILAGVAGAAAIAGGVLLVLDLKAPRSVAATLVPSPQGATAAISGQW